MLCFNHFRKFTLACLALTAAAVPASQAATASFPSAALASCSAAMDGQLPASTPSTFQYSGNVRRYYVAAEEVVWDYAPSGWDNWLGVPLSDSPRYAMYKQYGSKWLKALYRGYTDSTFSEYSPQPPWQGTQGPTIRAEVGDLVEIMFVNKLSKNYATMHSMGLAYSKANEGADYPNNTAPGQNVVLVQGDAVPPIENGVPPKGCVVYKWMVTAGAGPNYGEPARVHSYHSYVALQQDSNAGLIGPQIIYAPGQMNHTMNNYREIPLLYNVYVESDSWLSAENKARLASTSPSSTYGHSGASRGSPYGGYPTGGGQNSSTASSGADQAAGPFGSIDTSHLYSGNVSVWQPQVMNLAGAGQFAGAPSFYTMNGYIFSNNPPYQMCEDDKVIWYINAYGSASHVFHMHGNGFSYNSANYYAISINDGVGKTLYMNATGLGIWQVICHVANHHTLGMVSNYEVYPAAQCPLPPLGS